MPLLGPSTWRPTCVDRFARRGATEWKDDYGVQLEHYVFHLGDDLPLSWQLSDKEVKVIKHFWPSESDDADDDQVVQGARADNDRELSELKKFCK